ncbi:hypothetical protein BDV93DRAFT_4287 [Ceratobasidium sp. AG-I]|nr:hypothetical protein BDV93DRAFT_4287 [Ceratobasidium sp. AG-I]
MYFPDPVLIRLARRDNIAYASDPDVDNSKLIAWVVTVIVLAVVIVGVWCLFKLWGSRARNARAEQELGVTSLPPLPRLGRRGNMTMTMRPQEESLPVYDSQGRPPTFTISPLGMPPPAYLMSDPSGREVYRREGSSLGSIAEKEEENIVEKKDGATVEAVCRASV